MIFNIKLNYAFYSSNYIAFVSFKKGAKSLTLVRLVVVPCPPVVEVLIKRPDTKYQLGFSVQDGIVSFRKLYTCLAL